MQINFSKIDIIGLFSFLNVDSASINQCLDIKDFIIIQKTLPIGSATIEISFSTINGSLILNIVDAKVLGNSMFGLVRKFAGEFIISFLNNYKFIKTIKNKGGNIEINSPYFNIDQCLIKDGIINLILTIC